MKTILSIAALLALSTPAHAAGLLRCFGGSTRLEIGLAPSGPTEARVQATSDSGTRHLVTFASLSRKSFTESRDRETAYGSLNLDNGNFFYLDLYSEARGEGQKAIFKALLDGRFMERTLSCTFLL